MLNLGKAFVKKIMRVLLGEYSIYYIYAKPNREHLSMTGADTLKVDVKLVDTQMIRACSAAEIREQAGYLGKDSCAYAGYVGDEIAGVCVYWHGERYQGRGFIPLRGTEAKLVQVITAPENRGRGVATQLISQSYDSMIERGFKRTYARVWHSNTPSRRAFERAGWANIALIIEISPFWRKRPMKLRFNNKSRRKNFHRPNT